jgi:DNA modification methylase
VVRNCGWSGWMRRNCRTIPVIGGGCILTRRRRRYAMLSRRSDGRARCSTTRKTGRLIDGHLRKKIAKKGEKVPVLIGSWNAEEEAKILATLDPIGMMAEIDRHALEALLGSVRFESSAIASLLESLAGEAAAQCLAHPEDLIEPPDQIERADELWAKWKPAPEQVWTAGLQRITCGDSSKEAVVAALWRSVKDRARLLWCDAPYGVAYGTKTAWMEKRGAQRKRAAIKNDTLDPNEIRSLFGASLKLASNYSNPGAAVYATVPSGSLLPYFIAGLEDGGFTFKHSLVWVKNSMVLGPADYSYRHETILYGWLPNGAHYFVSDRTQDSVLEIDRPQASPFHPTTKPIALVARMIMNSSRKGELVLDPYCGSGTALLACEQLGRIGCGIELEPRYVAVTLERLNALGLKPKLIATYDDLAIHRQRVFKGGTNEQEAARSWHVARSTSVGRSEYSYHTGSLGRGRGFET